MISTTAPAARALAGTAYAQVQRYAEAAEQLSMAIEQANRPEEMVEAAGVRSNNKDPLRPPGKRRFERKLEVGVVLVGRMALYRRAIADRIVEKGSVHRVHVADHEINGKSKRLRMVQPAVGGDHVGVIWEIEAPVDRDRLAAR